MYQAMSPVLLLVIDSIVILAHNIVIDLIIEQNERNYYFYNNIKNILKFIKKHEYTMSNSLFNPKKYILFYQP